MVERPPLSPGRRLPVSPVVLLTTMASLEPEPWIKPVTWIVLLRELQAVSFTPGLAPTGPAPALAALARGTFWVTTTLPKGSLRPAWKERKSWSLFARGSSGRSKAARALGRPESAGGGAAGGEPAVSSGGGLGQQPASNKSEYNHSTRAYR